MWTVLRLGRTGATVPLLFIFLLVAGASATFSSARGGAFTFDMSALPSNAWLDFGSAFMLIAGADVGGISAFGGALTFTVNAAPSWASWYDGSANNNPYIN